MKNQGSKSEKMVLSTQKKIGEKLRNLKNCPDNRWGFNGAICNTRPPRDQTLYGLVLVKGSECIYSFASLHATPQFKSSFCPTLISFFQPHQNMC